MLLVGSDQSCEADHDCLVISSGGAVPLAVHQIDRLRSMEAEVPNVNQSQAGRLDNQQDPSRAIFTVSDTLAMGALKLCKASGLRVPGDVALASLDDISIVGLVDPALTTVPLLARKLGQEAMAMLISLI